MTKTTAIVRDERASYEGMAIVRKYESFLNYAYPKVQNCPRRHGILRDAVLVDMLAPVAAFYAAGKSSQVSRLYAIDAQLAALRFWLQQDLGETDWFRYMDDIVVLGTSIAQLRELKTSIERYSAEHLGLRFSKWSVAPASRGINFLGYRIWADHKLLRVDSVVRARRKIAAYRAAGDTDRLQRFLGAWLGHASHADTRNLIRALGVANG